MRKHLRTQIVVTLGPATKERATIRALIVHGMDVARLNFSWGTHEEHAGYIARTREAAVKAGRRIPLIQDLSGPRIQDGDNHRLDTSAKEVLTEKDIVDLAFGLRQRVDYVCLSFVREARDIMRLQEAIAKRNGDAKVMAKIERAEALANLDGIIAVSDAVMIGRGDLRKSIPLERIPFVESVIIKKCNAARKPVITATQMLLSMTERSEPTCAEITDVAYAVILGSDAMMLSEETARGKYPVEAVQMMGRIIREAETHVGDSIVRAL